ATALQAGYLLFRFIVPFCSDPGAEWPDWVCWVAAGTVFYAGVLACAQDQLRSLAGYLALSGLATALIAGVAGTAWTSLVGWQIALIVSLAVTSTWLLIGRLEQTFETTAISALGAIARSAPVTFSLLCVGLGLMTASPAVSLINGQAVSSLLRLSQTTGPTWAMILGQLLGAWAALRAMLSIGFGPTAEQSAKQSSSLIWKLATGGLLTFAVLGGVAPDLWQPPIRPTWVKIHDPFADAIVPAGLSPSAPHPHTSLRERHHRETRKPPILAEDRPNSWAGWLIAPTVWLICGGLLWGTSRLLVTVRGVNWLAAGCVVLGVMTEFATYAFSIPNHAAAWQEAACWSSALVGLAALTLRSESALPMSSSIAGGWLLRIGAIGWAAVTGNIVVCGLAWELAEFASGASLDSTAASHSKERVRRLISSLCFWLGIGCCRAVAGTWDIPDITAGFPETAAELTPGGLRLGFVALFLMISGVCCRCGLAPWSLGRRDTGDRVTFSASTLDQWLAEMTGLVVLLKIVLMMRGHYGEPMFVLLSIAGAGTAVWSGLSLVGEEKIRPLVRNLSTRQFSGVVIALAWLALANRFEDAASPIRLGHESALAIWAAWVFSFSVMMTGLTALLIRLGVDDQPDLYLENYAGLFSRRPWEASALTGCLLSVSGGIPLALFWPEWLSGIMAVMTPMLGSTTLHSPTLVALGVAVCFLLAGLMQLSVVSRWIWTILFDPAVSLPKISANRWQVALIAGMAAYCLAGGIQPAGLWSLWLSIGR
ncbi:MAG: proton-conducting transporter membrane subunit, partial [Planctomycetaceae bacterium]